MRDVENRRTLEAVQDSRVYDLLSAAISSENKCEVSWLVQTCNDGFEMDRDLLARRFI